MTSVHPSDLSLLGLGLDIAGAVLLARSFMLKRLLEIYYETRTYFGGNAFLLKSGLLQRAEAWGGACLLLLGFALQILGSLRLFSESAPRLLIGLPGLIAVLIVAGLVYAVAQWIAATIGRRHFYQYNLRNYQGGRPFKTPDTPEKEEELRRSGLLYDMEPNKGESMVDFAERLNDVVSALGVHYRSQVSLPRDRAKDGTGKDDAP